MGKNDLDVPLDLQPVTPHGKVKEIPGTKKLLDAADACGKYLSDIRIIPQVHKILGMP